MLNPATQHFVHSERRRLAARATVSAHPLIPSSTHSSIFPLYHPGAVDVLVHWSLPAQGRSGFVLATGVVLGAAHAPLRDALERAENTRPDRNMYAETTRERAQALADVQSSVWNHEMDPVVVMVGDSEVEHDFGTDG